MISVTAEMFLDGKRQPIVDNLRALIDGWLATEQLKSLTTVNPSRSSS